MGVLDDLQRQLNNAQNAAEAERMRALAEQQQQRRASRQGGQLPPNWPKPKSKIRAQADRGDGRTTEAQSAGSQRVGGRLQRENLEKAGPPAIAGSGPSSESFRRNVAAMQAGEPQDLRALPGYDLGLDVPAPAAAAAAARQDSRAGCTLTLGPEDILRAVVLGGILGEPKGRGQGRHR